MHKQSIKSTYLSLQELTHHTHLFTLQQMQWSPTIDTLSIRVTVFLSDQELNYIQMTTPISKQMNTILSMQLNIPSLNIQYK